MKSVFASARPKQGYPFCLNIVGPMFLDNPDGDVGIEVEVEGQNLPRSISPLPEMSWETKEDGSLRNGLEYITSGPIPYSVVPKAVTHLYTSMADSKLVLSTRCSTHVHVNLKDMNFGEICSFVILWGCFERVLTEWCNPTRVNNHFCVALVDSKRLIRDWTSFFLEGLVNFQNDRRYASLNPMSMDRFGSLEIRTMEGCATPERLIKWVDIVMALKNFSVSRYSNPQDLVSDFSAIGPFGLLDQMLIHLPECRSEVFGLAEEKNVDINASAYQCLRLLQPIVYHFPWEKAQPMLRRVSHRNLPNPFKLSRRDRPGRLPTQNRRNLPFNGDESTEESSEDDLEKETPSSSLNISPLRSVRNLNSDTLTWMSQADAERLSESIVRWRNRVDTQRTLNNESQPTATTDTSATVVPVQRGVDRLEMSVNQDLNRSVLEELERRNRNREGMF